MPPVAAMPGIASMPGVTPMPPRIAGLLPWVGAGIGLLRDPTGFFVRGRQRLGDTFIVDAFGYRLFCVFSPDGVRQLYALPEEQASFGLATYELVLKRKVPPELLDGRRTFPHDLFARQEVEDYLENLEEAMRVQIDELGDGGTFEIFETMRRLGHRLGLSSWAGRETAAPRHLNRLLPAFTRLDTADAFVQPAHALITYATGKIRERKAMHAIEAVIAEILQERRATGTAPGDYLDQIDAAFSDLPSPEREVNVARDIMVIHMGAQSNLPAALAWTLVNVVRRPELQGRVAAGDDTLLEQCANESIRMAQRSITLRQVLQPTELVDGKQTYRLAPGVIITTMLSVTNTTAAPGLTEFDPAHYTGRRLSDAIALPARELVSTFGHGRHSCPAQRFSISAIRIAITRLLEHYELEPRFTEATPRIRQIGGVARAARPCPVAYRRRRA
jgi:cytochrome P450